jgi:hypothetical protein
VCGICAEVWAGRAGVPHHEIKWHELSATVAAWGSRRSLWRIFLDDRRRGDMALYLSLSAGLYFLIARRLVGASS